MDGKQGMNELIRCVIKNDVKYFISGLSRRLLTFNEVKNKKKNQGLVNRSGVVAG